MAEDKYAARSWQADASEVSVSDQTLWIELGHLRALVEAADRIGISDLAGVSIEGPAKHYTRINEYTVKKLTVRESVTRQPLGSEGDRG